MAVLQMDQIKLCAMSRDRKEILELLQLRGAVEIRDVPTADELFKKNDMTTAQETFRKNVDTASLAAEILQKYAPVNKPSMQFLQGRKVLTTNQHEDFKTRREDVLQSALRIIYLEREISKLYSDLLRCNAQEEALRPWLDLPVPQTFAGTKKTSVFIGSISGEKTQESLLNMLLEANSELERVHVEIVSCSPDQTNFYLIALNRDTASVEEALRTIGFIRPASPGKLIPKQMQKQLIEQRENAKARIEACESEIMSYEALAEDLHLLEDDMRMRAEKYAVIERLAQSKHAFILEGYVLQREAKKLQQELMERFTCAVEISAVPAADDDVPVCLENNWFSRPLEGVLDSYALPAKGELDPTGIMSIFYYIMFGLMFSDAGYGLILAAATAIALRKFKNMERGTRMFLQMFFWCGISTIFWGVVFSSYFGDVADVFAITFLGKAANATPLLPPLWFLPLEKPMWLLMFCLAIGVVHLTVGYVLSGITNFRNGNYSTIVYDVVFPLTFVYPLLIILVDTSIFENMLGFPVYSLPQSVSTVCAIIAAVSALGIILFAGRESRNWGKRLLKGLYALYNVGAGWLSDILSYSRLLALGLATGVIASVMNQLGTLAGGGFIGVLLFVLVFIIGQALNFGINILGAYVHSNRLEYVEFFGKFYEGGGRRFSPLAINTKRFRIVEETQNV